ncbi:lipopolysaccharide biosynthesis protein [Exiguobacterium aurantiacum]|uniref:lipopolysaccharide biosynthesis protein n=1 Tax=Exiguobacterium aurantiacum TaxID=33987 RepID=UPI0008778804|nr:oligosaccharide flippase family protein [Exiguobacterium aurantiacum]
MLNKIFSFSLGSLGSLIIGLISIPIITRLLSPDEFGIASLFMTIATVLSTTALLGTDQSLIRYFFEKNRVSLLMKSIKISFLTIGILVVIILNFNKEISLIISEKNTYGILLILYILISVIHRFSTIVLRMMQYGYRFSFIQILQRALELVLVIVIGTTLVYDHLTLIYSWILSLLILSVLTNVMIIPFWKQANENNSEIKFSEIISYSGPFAISAILIMLFQSADKLLLGTLSTTREIGIYMATFKIVGIINVIQSTFTTLWTPVSLKRFRDYPKDKQFFELVFSTTTIIMVTLGVTIALFKEAIILVLGPDYREAVFLLPLLLLMPILYTMSEITVQGVNFYLKSRLHIRISIVVLISNISLSLLFIPFFGAKGAALAVAISYILFYGFRTKFGTKFYSFNTSSTKVFIIIGMYFLWSLEIMFLNFKTIDKIGGLIILLVTYTLFRKEYSVICKFINNKVKNYL